jgi:hypothetical protein
MYNCRSAWLYPCEATSATHLDALRPFSIKSLNYHYDDDNCAAASSSSSSDFPMTIADSFHAIRMFTDSVRVNMQAELTGAAVKQDKLHNLFHFN